MTRRLDIDLIKMVGGVNNSRLVFYKTLLPLELGEDVELVAKQAWQTGYQQAFDNMVAACERGDIRISFWHDGAIYHAGELPE